MPNSSASLRSAGVCGIIRTYELQGLSARSDYSYETVSLVIWSASELLITILCANIPMLRPFWAKRGTRAGYPSDQRRTPDANPTIGSARQHPGYGLGAKKDRNTWSELEDVDNLTMASQLGGPKQGKTRTVVRGRVVGDDEDARSSDSILRPEMGMSIEEGTGRRESAKGIEVSRKVEVSDGSVSTVGRAW